MRHLIAGLLVLVLIWTCASSLAFDDDYTWYYDGDAPRDQVYSHGASSLIRDWGIRDAVDVMTVVDGSLNGYTGGSGIFACMMGYDYQDYDMYLMTVDEAGRSQTDPIPDSEKGAALTAYFLFEDETLELPPSVSFRSRTGTD